MIKKPIIKFVGYILLFLGLSMFATSLWPLYYNENDFFIFIKSGLITSITALILLFFSRGTTKSEINLRDGFYVVGNMILDESENHKHEWPVHKHESSPGVLFARGHNPPLPFQWDFLM